jgi:hypothetical protein
MSGVAALGPTARGVVVVKPGVTDQELSDRPRPAESAS